MYVYTLAFVTRLKRRVFLSRNIPDEVIKILTVRISSESLKILSYEFLDYGMIVTFSSPVERTCKDLSHIVRTSTSPRIREMFPELWSLPSLWSLKVFMEEGSMTPEMRKRIDDFYRTV